jgi:hypothetical protein
MDWACGPFGYLDRMFPHLRSLVLLLSIPLLSVAMAQEPTPCELVVPGTLSPNAELPAQSTCPCRVSAFEATVWNRWAVEVWRTDTMAGFPQGLLNVADLPGGTYLWKVKYTAIATGDAVELERSGYINVLK